MLVQESGYGCGLYAVANALNLDYFVSEERLEDSRFGVGNGKLNKYLIEDEYDVFIDVLYCDSQVNNIPEVWCKIYSENKDTVMPILIQCEINEKYHLMGAWLLNEEGKIVLFDSLKKESISCTLSDVNKMYDRVFALYSFNKISTTEYIAIDSINIFKK